MAWVQDQNPVGNLTGFILVLVDRKHTNPWDPTLVTLVKEVPWGLGTEGWGDCVTS